MSVGAKDAGMAYLWSLFAPVALDYRDESVWYLEARILWLSWVRDWWRIRQNAPEEVQGRPVQIVLLQFLIFVSFTFDKLTTFRRLAKLPVAITNILKERCHDLRMCEICAVQAEATRSNSVFLNLIRLRFTPVVSYSFYCSLDGQLFKAKFHAIFLDQRL